MATCCVNTPGHLGERIVSAQIEGGGRRPGRGGPVVHAPTAAPRTQREMVRLLAHAAGVKGRRQV